MPSRIEDYALIGDCQTAALVGRDGSIDWLCFPRFDSSPCFAALLGTPEHGRWQIAPVDEIRRTQRGYRKGTLVLETEFETAGGKVAVIDCMPSRSKTPDIVRIVEGRGGQVPMRLELVIRFDYGSIIPWVRRTQHGIRATAGPDTLYCRTDVELHGEDMRTIADFLVTEGQRVFFGLTWAATYAPEPEQKNPEEMLRETEQWWCDWSERCTYQRSAKPWLVVVRQWQIARLARSMARPTSGPF